MIAVDTNLLIYAHRSKTAEHHRARSALEAAAADPRGWGTALASVGEFFSIVTHPAASGRPSKPKEARAFLETLSASAGMQIWTPGAGFATRLLQLAIDLEIVGVRVFDLQIALTAVDHGATELWTNDRDFVRIPGLRLRRPLDT